jgi:serine/threonine protein kinase
LGDTFKHHPLSVLALDRETQKIQSLAHPNIITVYDFDRDGDNIYMTMEVLEGQSLDEVIRHNKNGMSFHDARNMIEGMSQALIYAHSKNIIHSDFKPENVFLTKNKVTKVLDFGIARAQKLPGHKPVDTAFDAGSLSALTPPYASLEMIQDKDPDPRDDIYALACVTYKLLSGKHPYNNLQADIAQKAEMKPARIKELNRRQWQTLLAGLAYEREDRIETVEEFLDGIKPKKRGWMYALAASVIIAIVASGYLGTSITEQNAIPKVILTQDQKNKIKNYLEIADLYYSLGYLATPPGDSALDQYENILAIDPTNKDAIEGKKKLVERYQVLASEKLKLKEYEESLQLLETALLIEPDNEDVIASQNKVKNLRAEN